MGVGRGGGKRIIERREKVIPNFTRDQKKNAHMEMKKKWGLSHNPTITLASTQDFLPLFCGLLLAEMNK